MDTYYSGQIEDIPAAVKNRESSQLEAGHPLGEIAN
jgi:hypothetical protein